MRSAQQLTTLGFLLLGTASGTQKSLLDSFECKHPSYKIHKASSAPQVIYIENFLTEVEREHLKTITYGLPPSSLFLISFSEASQPQGDLTPSLGNPHSATPPSPVA